MSTDNKLRETIEKEETISAITLAKSIVNADTVQNLTSSFNQLSEAKNGNRLAAYVLVYLSASIDGVMEVQGIRLKEPLPANDEDLTRWTVADQRARHNLRREKPRLNKLQEGFEQLHTEFNTADNMTGGVFKRYAIFSNLETVEEFELLAQFREKALNDKATALQDLSFLGGLMFDKNNSSHKAIAYRTAMDNLRA